MKRASFTARLHKPQARGGWVYVVTPFAAAEWFGRRGAIPVTGTIDGQAFTDTLRPSGDGSHFLPVRADLRRTLGKESGDEVRVELELAEVDQKLER